MGRSLDNSVLNLDMRNTYETSTRKLGFVSAPRCHAGATAALAGGFPCFKPFPRPLIR